MDENETQQLRSLIRLAREKAHHNRRILRDNVTDLFLSPSARLSERQISLMSDILHTLIHQFEMALRSEIAERLAHFDWEPPGLAASLKDDRIDMARSILLGARPLRNTVLMEIVRLRAEEHILAESRAESIDSRRPAALDTGSGNESPDDVVRTLMASDDPILALRARDFAIAQAARTDGFQRPALVVSDLPRPLAQKLHWWIAAALRRHILAARPGYVPVDQYMLDDVIEDATRTVLRNIDRTVPTLTPAERLVERMAEIKDLSTSFLLDAMRQGYLPLFTAGLALLGHIEREATRRIVFDRGGEPLALACKAVGFSRSEFEEICTLTRHGIPAGQQRIIVQELVRLFDAVSPRVARRSLDYWTRSSEYMSAIEQMRN